MKKIIFLLFIALFFGCSDDLDDVLQVDSNENLEVEDFLYKVMNYAYYWQGDVPHLADDKFSNDKDYTAFLQSFEGPKDLFQGVLFNEDVYSRVYDDYEAYEDRKRGVTVGNGMNFGLVRMSNSDSNIYGYVQYVLPNSEASTKGVSRGDVFTHVDGVQLTLENYRALLFSNTATYTINSATIENDLIQDTGLSITLNNSELTENSVYLSKVITHNEIKVGYIMYNGFVNAQEDDVKAAFTSFQTQQIDELVVDLRYNPGGSVVTAQLLAGLIAGEHSGKVFAKVEYSEKQRANNAEIAITNTNTQLGLSRVFFLTTKNAASASEMLINGLSPYITTIHIGDKTAGKDVGATEFYDYIARNTLNPNHKYVAIPITFKIYNSEGVGDYSDGLTPDIQLPEVLSNLGVLGEPDEPLLKKALEIISGETSVTSSHLENDISPLNQIQVKEGSAIFNLTN